MWWKYLSILLILYAIVFGLRVPLKPGIQTAFPAAATANAPFDLNITGYNTVFSQSSRPPRVWLKTDNDQSIQASRVQVLSDVALTAHFDMPSAMPSAAGTAALTLLVDDSLSGVALFPKAVSVSAAKLDSTVAMTGQWATGAISNLHFQHDLKFPYRNILYETIRNIFYHVPLWFAMMLLFLASVVYSIIYLSTSNPAFDQKAKALTEVGTLFGILGLITGAIWAKNTWGAYWSSDVKQNMSAVLMMVYFAYFVLRGSFDDLEKAARLGAVYSIFAFASIIPLLFIIPRLYSSLHPGNGGNPALGGEDLDHTMQLVFYPAVIGFTLLGFWLAQLEWRRSAVEQVLLENE